MRSDLAGVTVGVGTARGARAAVLLNANAKQVTPRVLDALASVVPSEDLYLSSSADEANRIAADVVARRYATVFTGGGDGTFVSWVNRILDQAQRRAAPHPAFGVLALGTGNAVAEVVGARERCHVSAIRSWRAGQAPVRRLPLLACGGRRTPFAGAGVDAALVNDYNWLKSRLAGTALRPLALGIPGYFAAGLVRTAPRALTERRTPYCEIVNVGAPAWRLAPDGRPVGPPIGHGELLHAGPCMLAAASTVPFYGFGMKAFPHAFRRPGHMQLRVMTRVPVATVLRNLPRIWSGEFAHPALLDFHAERVTVTFERPVPLQIGGDAEGWHERIELGMTGEVVDLVDFRGLPN
jgi:diacylglycerol kinase family enzyme